MSNQRPATYDDVLIRMHLGQWWTWSDTKNRTYDNLVMQEFNGNPALPKPSKSELDGLLLAAQETWDGNDYRRKRKGAFPDKGDQLDMIYQDLKAAGITGEFTAAIEAVKNAHPKS